MKRKESKKEAALIAATLIGLAVETAPRDIDLARAQASLARRIMLKFNVRYDWRLRRFFCHGCKGLLYPGVNARVRLGPGKTLLVTCGDCNYVNRKKLASHA
ncbi:MAG: RNase P subunit [Nitrososphaerales archaeon]